MFQRGDQPAQSKVQQSKWILSAMTSENKMAAVGGGLCMEGLWRGWCFTIIGMKKLQDMFA